MTPDIEKDTTAVVTEKEVEVTKPEFDKNELLTIFDEILFSGEYREDVLIKNKLRVTFKSRTASDTSEITREIDKSSFNLMAALQEHRAFLNLAYSVVSYNGKDLSAAKIEDRKVFIGKLPAVVVGALSEALVKFDRKTDAACAEGEINF